MFRDTLVYHLRGEGYFVLLATDGPAAVEMARHNPLALILLALQLPNTEGLRLCHQLRSNLSPHLAGNPERARCRPWAPQGAR